MKLSTRIKKEVREDYQHLPIVIMVDCKTEYLARTMEDADRIHKDLVATGCTLLTNECPVVNGYEIVMHYTSTTYAKWCEADDSDDDKWEVESSRDDWDEEE